MSRAIYPLAQNQVWKLSFKASCFEIDFALDAAYAYVGNVS